MNDIPTVCFDTENETVSHVSAFHGMRRKKKRESRWRRGDDLKFKRVLPVSNWLSVKERQFRAVNLCLPSCQEYAWDPSASIEHPRYLAYANASFSSRHRHDHKSETLDTAFQTYRIIQINYLIARFFLLDNNFLNRFFVQDRPAHRPFWFLRRDSSYFPRGAF